MRIHFHRRAVWGAAVSCIQLAVAIQLQGATVNVDIVNYTFSPATVNIDVGDTVTWTQRDFIQHTATSDTGVFSSPYLSRGQTFSFTFMAAGTYGYYCEPHTYMVGTIVVKAAASSPPAAPIPITVAAKDQGFAMSLQWSGGKPPYLLQKKLSLADAAWFNVLTTDEAIATVAKESSAGFFRIQDQAQIQVLPFTALLSGGAEVPPVATGANGTGTLALEGNKLSYIISYHGLSGAAGAAHIHGPANALGSAAPMIAFSGPFGSSGVLIGSSPATPAQIDAFKAGQTYVNFHTAANGGGEIRGQIVPLQLRATLTGAAEVPQVATTAHGKAVVTLIGPQAIFDIKYEGLSSDPTAAHLHGPADASQAAAPILPLPAPNGKSGSIHSFATLNAPQLVDLLAGRTYLNIHTANHGGGEIRGQLTP
ncbi:MAG: CHRD domain-containing protein [Verrucomicrobia bacterium]|nr:CHRD domain-containing protein [Verrucomicrobiota bacterium]